MNDIVCSIDKVNPSESMLSCRQRPPWNAIRTIDPSWPLDWIIAPLPAPAFIRSARPSTLANDDRHASSPAKISPGIQDGAEWNRSNEIKKKERNNKFCFESTTLVSFEGNKKRWTKIRVSLLVPRRRRWYSSRKVNAFKNWFQFISRRVIENGIPRSKNELPRSRPSISKSV